MSPDQSRQPRMLLLEDDPVARAALLGFTRRLPAKVDQAASIAEAMPLALAGGHALWLFDVHLPDGSGIWLLERLRAQGLRTPALAHTTLRTQRMHDTLRTAGFAAVAWKPVDEAAWRDAVRDVMEGGTRIAEAAAPYLQAAGEMLPLWDEASAAKALNGNVAHVAQMRGMFLAELPSQRDAILRGDAAQRRAHLHRLVAGCGYAGALRLQTAARTLHAAPDSEALLRAFADVASQTLTTAPR